MVLPAQPRVPRRRALALGACVLGAAALLLSVLVAGSCTTFDGVELPRRVPPPPATVDGYLSLEDAARVCTRVMGCGPLAGDVLSGIAVPLDTLNFSLCMEWAAGPIPPTRVGFNFQQQALQCVAKAESCLAAEACVPLETMEPDDPRCQPDAGAKDTGVPGDGGNSGDADAGGSGDAPVDDSGDAVAQDAPAVPDAPDPNDLTEWCADDGGTVIKCKGQYKYALHCNTGYYAPGSRCVEDVDHTKWCAVGDNCAVASSCLNLMLDYCGGPEAFVHESINCRFGGRTCGTDPDSGMMECLTGDSLQQCSAAGADCRGDVVAVCDGTTISEFDCAALKRTCTEQQGAARCMKPDADVCTPFDQTGVNECTGTTIALCIGGAKVSFDCAKIGMTCVPGAGAQSSHCG